MGESAACLVRSFSQPSPTSDEEKKGNHIDRALTASVSFGRFMSESLDWGKWSAFTNNRYLEEVEKYSKPGSVAEKKAYFEAHFKRRRAAALLEQQNAAACSVSETENTEDKIDDGSSLDSGHVQRASYLVNENMKAEIQSRYPVVPSGQSGDHDISIKETVEDTKSKGTEKAVEPLANCLEDDVCIGDTVSKNEDNMCNKVRTKLQDDSAIRNSASGEKIPEVSSAKMSTRGVASIIPPSMEPAVPVQLKNGDKSPESKRNSTDSSNKRRSYITSLHMSISLASCSGVTQKDISSGLPKIGNSKTIRAPAKKYKNSTLPQTSRASVNGLIKHFSAASTAENRRSVRPHGDSISEAKTTDEKVQSPSSNYSKSSSLFGSKARLPTVPSSFTFKSEERAVKRREFFQMLEQKTKLKEKHQMHPKPQVTAGRSNDKDVRNSIAVETSKGAEAPLRNITKKIPTVRPGFPKIEERADAFKVQDSNIMRPPWRFSVKTEGSKDLSAKNSRPPSHSAKCVPKKIMNENASPNIQL